MLSFGYGDTTIKLHRAGKRADWEGVERRRRNAWQRMASDTGGIITPGNTFTVVGFILVLAGLALVAYNNYWGGFGLIAAGRFCDLLDGWLADKTGTKSPLGEKADGSADKLETGAALLVLAATGLVPWQLAMAVSIPHIIIAFQGTFAALRGISLHPSRLGKYAMAVTWVGLLLFVLGQALSMPQPGIWYGAAYVVCAAAIVMAGYVAYMYNRVLMHASQRHKTSKD